MSRRLLAATALGATLLAGAAFAPAASAGTSWSVSIGGPGYYVSAAEGWPRHYYEPYRPYWRPYSRHRHYYGPPVVYAPRYVYPAPVYAPPRVVYRAPYYRPYDRPYYKPYYGQY
jgi:hypothetical protein